MSHWLSNVNNLLTKLDDQAENVAETFALDDDLSSDAIDAGRTGINDILVKRGLSSVGSKDGAGGEEKAVKGGDSDDDNQTHIHHENEKKAIVLNTVTSGAMGDTKGTDKKNTARRSDDSTKNNTDKDSIGKKSDNAETTSLPVLGQQSPVLKGSETERKPVADALNKGESDSRDFSLKQDPEDKPIPSTSPKLSVIAKEQQSQPRISNSPDSSRKEIRELVLERKEAQKEARTLQRHIVSLNDQLEAAELELQAQRKELEQAAARMEKDRGRHAVEKEALQKGSHKEITLLKTQHEKIVKDQQVRFEEQLERYRKKLTDEEKRRKQEGGDWDKEMSNAIDREHDIQQKLIASEEEKAVLLSQISTLQGQQTALGSRLESLSQAADNAMQRERDAENRLDDALSQHAQQIGHRQARESQLEKTIQDLNAALVSSRSGSGLEGNSDDYLNEKSHLEARICALESDLQTANSHLNIEKERSETLQTQLRSFSNETTQEASIIHAKEIQYDRQIAEMSLTILELEAKLRKSETEPPSNPNSQIDSSNEAIAPNRVKVLSEEVVKLQDRIANQNSERLAMKSRLKAAIEKSSRLEEELQNSKLALESDRKSYSSAAQGSGRRRRNNGLSSNESIRTAMLLNSSAGDRTEQIGQVVDHIDSFAASTGKYLKRQPLARAGFIFYLFLMHLWTFVLLFFHAHSFNTAQEADLLGNGVGSSHGPHAIMQQQLRLDATNLANEKSGKNLIGTDFTELVSNTKGK